MIAETLKEARTLLGSLPSPRAYPEPREILMVTPDHYRIDYAINPYMKDEDGTLKAVNSALAKEQWKKLRWVYQDLGMTVHEILGRPELPDMVFAANQSFPFRDRETGEPSVVMARMRAPERQPEVRYFEAWFQARGYRVHFLETSSAAFEGNGDALVHPKVPLVWGGYGARTDRKVYQEISDRLGLQVILLKLQRPEYYHLDTCFSILSPHAVALVEEALPKESLKIVYEVFDTVIPIDPEEARRAFAGNCHCPNQRDVLLAKGSPKFRADLERAGFATHELDLTEFHKAGGSVFCLKLALC